MTATEAPVALTTGVRIDEYILESVLSHGASSITYQAAGPERRQYVIKEYYPARICHRVNHRIEVASGRAEAEYREGLRTFCEIALKLSGLDSKHLPKIGKTVSENRTAYMVMDYIEGVALNDILYKTGTLDEDDIQQHLLPLLDGLDCLHGYKLQHLGLCPRNILIRSNGTPVLIGIASLYGGLISHQEPGIIGPGYAPMEQYGGRADLLGPWTDIYTLAAVLYRCISGSVPEDAVSRYEVFQKLRQDPLIRAVDIGRGKYSERLLAAIDHGLEILPRDRPASVNDWRREFLALTEKRDGVGSASDSTGYGDHAAGGKAGRSVHAADYPDETEERFKLFRAALGGKRQSYYMSQMHAQDGRGLLPRASWNWAGFLFSIFWACYRKMGVLVLCAGVPLLTFIACFLYILIGNYVHYDKVYFISPEIDLTAVCTVLVTSAGMGIFGNYFYYLYLRWKIHRARKKFPDVKSRRNYLSRRGGTSLFAAVLFLILAGVSGCIGYGYLEKTYKPAGDQIKAGMAVLHDVSGGVVNFRD